MLSGLRQNGLQLPFWLFEGLVAWPQLFFIGTRHHRFTPPFATSGSAMSSLE